MHNATVIVSFTTEEQTPSSAESSTSFGNKYIQNSFFTILCTPLVSMFIYLRHKAAVGRNNSRDTRQHKERLQIKFIDLSETYKSGKIQFFFYHEPFLTGSERS
jgi:hypothetical protein